MFIKRLSTQLKRQPTKWETIFANHLSDKGLIYRNIKKTPTTQQQQKPNFKNRQRI